MKLRALTLAVTLLALAACGDRAGDAETAIDSAAAGTGYDPDTTMAPPPMDTALTPATDSVATDSAAAQP